MSKEPLLGNLIDPNIERAMMVFAAAWAGKQIEFEFNGAWHVETTFENILDCLKAGFNSRIDCCLDCNGDGLVEVAIPSSVFGMDVARMDACEACGGTGRESDATK